MPTPPMPSGPPSGPTSKTSSAPPGSAPAPATRTDDPAPPPAAQAVLDFWFGAPGDPHFGQRRAVWFKADPAFDQAVDTHCAALHRDAAAGRLDDWAGAPRSCLALLLLLDQVPRNLFRRDCAAYATDAQARAVARAALQAGFDARLHPVQR